jgi:hypothetical protein
VREAGLTAAVRALGNPALGAWLTCDAPSALLEGTELPPAPPARRSRFRR